VHCKFGVCILDNTVGVRGEDAELTGVSCDTHVFGQDELTDGGEEPTDFVVIPEGSIDLVCEGKEGRRDAEEPDASRPDERKHSKKILGIIAIGCKNCIFCILAISIPAELKEPLLHHILDESDAGTRTALHFDPMTTNT
jgi:hypothetical protein